MLRLIGQIERHDIHGRKLMLPHVTFRVHRLTQFVAVEKYSFVWLGPQEPTTEQWCRMANEHARPKIEKRFGKKLAEEMIFKFTRQSQPVN